ncbi:MULTISPECIES: hypothetical protein [Bifidobacterium]|uniref:Uncharacterized protein n=1 Tax=Bifidobacterium cebidarum TaxID=2650773 RepID=A0A6I1G9Q2_9BIFI|nr:MULTISPECIES: hypothetical protein [Bifidobacterium]KAB7788393.1 hypothetical protein F7D08_1134 [Bifidobacterium cebidarum]
MSLKDSMLRGLALYGANSVAQPGMKNGQVVADIVNDSEKIAR